MRHPDPRGAAGLNASLRGGNADLHAVSLKRDCRVDSVGVGADDGQVGRRLRRDVNLAGWSPGSRGDEGRIGGRGYRDGRRNCVGGEIDDRDGTVAFVDDVGLRAILQAPPP